MWNFSLLITPMLREILSKGVSSKITLVGKAAMVLYTKKHIFGEDLEIVCWLLSIHEFIQLGINSNLQE